MLSVVTKVHADFIAFISAHWGHNESFKLFETWFDVLIAKFDLHVKDIAFCKPHRALQLFDTAHVEDNLWVSILAACVKNMKAVKDTNIYSKTFIFVKEIFYSIISDVLRQCNSPDTNRSVGAPNVNAGTSRKGGQEYQRKWSPTRRPRRLQKFPPQYSSR